MNDTIEIDGNKYKKLIICDDIRIVILQRGWSMIGYFTKDEEKNCTLECAHVIRKWGTTSGLGQLADQGKQENTVLDKAGTVNFDYLTVVATIKCNGELWKNVL